ncbi:MAG TPA: hypothetical protein PLM56_12865 [Cyclobacteriaceae bacterium]|nr:hypothetical protein [Cyclobacteriaceae bacterium]
MKDFYYLIFGFFLACASNQEEILYYSVTQRPTKKQLTEWDYQRVLGVDADIYRKSLGQWTVSYSFEHNELLAKQLEFKIDTLVLPDLMVDSILQQINFERTTSIRINTHINGISSMHFQCKNPDGDVLIASSQFDDAGNWLTLTYNFSQN